MKLSDFSFELPESLIAQFPTENRTDSRLLVSNNDILDDFFRNLGTYLDPGDLLVLNDTKVIPARLFGRKESGGKIEIMLERLVGNNTALVMIRSSRSPKIGSFLELENKTKVLVKDKQEGIYLLQFECDDIDELLKGCGHIPLPPYISRNDIKEDQNRYQTVYANHSGAVAAPTAGLHFDKQLLSKLKKMNIDHTFVTLHVASGTFQPVKVDNIEEHQIHSEYFEIDQNTADMINQTKKRGGKIIAVGTTSVRVLESSFKDGKVRAQKGDTQIFIYPGFNFNVVDKLITNFHLPKSSLLMLVSAFVGHEKMHEIYQHAIDKQYRFYSYGDSMLLTRSMN
jgi:S-adenosylmethionine:tRNA ribosyltransferase-isomerase